MKHSLKLGLVLLLLSNSTIYAANPRPGFYGGMGLGGTYSQSVSFYFTSPVTGLVESGKLNHGFYGNVFGQLGYRFLEHYRVEGEILANYNPYKKLTLASTTVTSTKTSTGYYLNGNTAMGAFLVNGLIDMFSPGSESGFSPYIGLGLGYAHIKNSIKLYYNGTVLTATKQNYTESAPVAQGILGAGYFADDFTWFGLDFRYLTTNNLNFTNSRMQVASINISFNGSFCL